MFNDLDFGPGPVGKNAAFRDQRDDPSLINDFLHHLPRIESKTPLMISRPGFCSGDGRPSWAWPSSFSMPRALLIRSSSSDVPLLTIILFTKYSRSGRILI